MAATIHDMQYHLQKISRDSIIIDTHDTSWQRGICIIKLDKIKDSIFDPKLDKSDPNAFMLRSDGHSSMQIIAYTTDGLMNGMYTYLDLLGFRWFHPGDTWTHIPDRKDITLSIDSVFKPDFLMRGYFGSYDTPRNRVIDKTRYVNDQWYLWARRNRQTGPYILHGHVWNDFLWNKLDSLKQHPEYMALVDGHRVVPTTAAKFCLSNKGMRALFVGYELSLLKKDMIAAPDRSLYYESVEPSDGYGDCQCDECKKMGSNTTRVFILANQVARAFGEVSPVAGVNLLAYNTHADTPNVSIEPNVLVQVVPYRYQSIMPPDKLIEAWETKKDTLFMYDYYGLPLLNIDMPLKGGLRPAPYMERVKYWYAHKVRGVLLESSCSIGATGLGLYLYSRTAWSLHSDTHELISEYYHLNYGAAADAMHQAQDMLGDTIDNRRALYNAISIISKKVHMRRLTPGQQARVVSYESYLHYLKLLYDYKRADKKDQIQSTDTLLRYAHSIFMRMMISQFPLVEYTWTYGPTGAFAKKYWDEYHPDAKDSKYPTVVQYTDEQIQALFKEDYKQLKTTIGQKKYVLPGKPCCYDTEDDNSTTRLSLHIFSLCYYYLSPPTDVSLS